MDQQKVATLGADPELFLADKFGQFVPAYGKIGGTKDKPIGFTPPRDRYDYGHPLQGYAYQEDGAALEFNIPPVTNHHAFINAIHLSLSWIQQNLLAKQGLRFLANPDQVLTPQFLGQPEAHNIGCVGDWCAWGENGGFKRKPFSSTDLGDRRFAGCHLHLGYDHEAVPRDIMAKLLDLYVGCRAVGNNIDKQGTRRKFYGLAGLYREKDYGLEYRTLSSAAMAMGVKGDSYYHLSEMARMALALGNLSYKNVDLLVDIFNAAPWDDVKVAIETENSDMAMGIQEWSTKYDLRC